MKVVMLQDVGGVGQRGKVVEVSDGYALNFLIPQGKAEQATPHKEAEAKKRIEAESAAKQQASAALHKALETLSGGEIVMTAKATEKGGLFKAITAADIVRVIHEQKGVQLPASALKLEKPIKETGEHTLQLAYEKAASKMRLLVKSS